MIDGIIQEVISIHNKNECKCKSACHNVIRIQQELIEKIKQLSRDRDLSGSFYNHQYYFRKLIGDNE